MKNEAKEAVKHSALPWVLKRVKFYPSHNGPKTVIKSDDDDGAIIATANNEANAALIVRAVNAHEDLVAALKGMVDAAKGVDDMALIQAADEARAALKKAGAA